MERSTFSVLFYIKRSKLLKDGQAPVYLRITVDGQMAEISLKRSVNPSIWDTARNKAKGNSFDAQELNDYLNSARAQVFNHYKQLQESGRLTNAKILRNAFLGLGEKQWTLKELFSEHNANMKMLVGKEYSPLTLQRFEAGLKHVLIFMKLQYNSQELALSEIDNKFITRFEFYLKATAKCQHNSAMKHVKALKKIIRIALANDYIRKDPFINYRITQKEVERNCLTENELRIIFEKSLTIERISVIRDLFLFQCYTGLAYRDLAELTPDNIQKGIDGRIWIYTRRRKTDVPCHIPLLPIAEKILAKYENHSCVFFTNKLFPVPSNQKMNAYLKELADLCEIKKKLHTHLARHTYATTVTLSNGIPMETVSKLLGHRKIQTTQVYAKVLDDKISAEMEILRQKLAI
jgi:site-specific recombinase XerD